MIGNAVWFEIPATNFERAVKFYEAVFQVTLRRENIGGDLAVFPAFLRAGSRSGDFPANSF